MSLDFAHTADATVAPVDSAVAPREPVVPASLTHQEVVSVTHWTDRLFSFCVARPPSFRFRSGQFIMLGLFIDGKPLLRAYSIASPSWDDTLAFFSIKVPDGPLTARLQHINPGDKVLLGKKPTGTLTLDALTPARTLYMLSTGTGIAPFTSLIRDPETFEKFDNVVLTQTCRTVAELAYGNRVVSHLTDDPLIGELVAGRLIHSTSVTQDVYPCVGRITTRVESGQLFREIGRAPFDPAVDRVMICGSMAMLKDMAALVEARGFTEGSNAAPAEYVIEKAFAG